MTDPDNREAGSWEFAVVVGLICLASIIFVILCCKGAIFLGGVR